MKLNFYSAMGDGESFDTYVESRDINTIEELIESAKEFGHPLICGINDDDYAKVLIYDYYIE